MENSPEYPKEPFSVYEKLDALFVYAIVSDIEQKEAIKADFRINYNYGFESHIEQLIVVNLLSEDVIIIQRPFLDTPQDSELRLSTFSDNMGGVLYKINVVDLLNRPYKMQLSENKYEIIEDKNYEVYEDRIRFWGPIDDEHIAIADITVADFEFEMLAETIEDIIGFEKIIKGPDLTTEALDR